MYITKMQCYKINACDTVYCLYVIFISWDDIYMSYIYMIYDILYHRIKIRQISYLSSFANRYYI